MLLWLALWTLVIVPAHRRGQLVVPGVLPGPVCCAPADAKSPAEAQGEARAQEHGRCCAPQSGKPMPEQRVRNCAICFLTATTQATDAIAFHPPPTSLLAVLPPLPYETLKGVAVFPDARARAPPAAAQV